MDPGFALLVGSIMLTAIAVRVALRYLPESHEPRCPRCGYNVTATPKRCPECGQEREPFA